jgi:hypothetical protein
MRSTVARALTASGNKLANATWYKLVVTSHDLSD